MLTSRFAMYAPLALMLLVTQSACSDDAEREEASATATSALQAQSQSGLTDGVLDTEGVLAPEAEEAAKTVAEHPTRGLRPEGCATKTREANVVTLKLDGCTGPFGKVTMHGSLTATFSRASADVLHVDIAGSDDLTANDATLHYAAGVDVRYDGQERTMTYHGHSEGKTKRGVDFARHTDLSVVADVQTKCVAIDGMSKGSIGKFDLDLTVDGFKGCRDACPTAGNAHATLRGPLGRETNLDVTFDGSDEAHVKGPKRSFDVALSCDDAEAAE